MLQHSNRRKAAFSIIELSVVMVIIGLIVATIVGGASLIKQATLRRSDC